MRMVVCVMVLAVASFAFAQGGTQSLPPAVKNAFDQAYPGATIYSATQERDNNRKVFGVDNLQKGKRRIVL